MNIADYAQTRYTTKAFDPAKTIPAALIEQVQTLLRHSPSSVNAQPWYFVMAGSAAGKASVATATQAGYAYNTPKVLNASHVVVLCARLSVDDAHLAAVLASEDQAGRFASPEAKTTQNTTRNFYVNLHRTAQDEAQWIEKQVYLALGTLLLGAATLGIDACPMEGFDAGVLDEALGLRARGLTGIALVALGYRSPEDFNAKLPKARLPAEAVLSEI